MQVDDEIANGLDERISGCQHVNDKRILCIFIHLENLQHLRGARPGGIGQDKQGKIDNA